MSESQDAWARETFSPARYAPEPEWSLDTSALLLTGRRRNRRRRLIAGGGVAGVTAAVMLGSVLWGPSAAPARPTPVATPTPTSGSPADLSKLSDYVYVGGETFATSDESVGVVPRSAADTMAAVVDRLDPTHRHLRSDPQAAKMTVVNDNTRADDITSLVASSQWTLDGSFDTSQLQSAKPHADLGIDFANSAAALHPEQASGQAAGLAPCGIGKPMLDVYQLTRAGVRVATWSQCTARTLNDGSTVETASLKVGLGTIILAIREFPAAGSITLTAANFAMANTDASHLPTAAMVLPTPWSEQTLANALSDPAVRAGLPPAPTAPPAGTLQAADLGGSWAYAPDRLDRAGDRLAVDNFGCGDPRSIVTARTVGVTSAYTGTLPSGHKAVVTEDTYPLQPGQGRSTMAMLRANADRTCPQRSADVTVTALPPGVGDAGFVMNGRDVYLEVGDTIIVLHVMDTTDATGPRTAMSATDLEWLTAVAKQAGIRASAE